MLLLTWRWGVLVVLCRVWTGLTDRMISAAACFKIETLDCLRFIPQFKRLLDCFLLSLPSLFVSLISRSCFSASTEELTALCCSSSSSTLLLLLLLLLLWLIMQACRHGVCVSELLHCSWSEAFCWIQTVASWELKCVRRCETCRN